jgi:hypothetical protein
MTAGNDLPGADEILTCGLIRAFREYHRLLRLDVGKVIQISAAHSTRERRQESRIVQRFHRGFELRRSDFSISARYVEILRRHRTRREQRLVTLESTRGRIIIGLRLVHGRLEVGRIDASQMLAGLNVLAFYHRQLDHAPGDFKRQIRVLHGSDFTRVSHHPTAGWAAYCQDLNRPDHLNLLDDLLTASADYEKDRSKRQATGKRRRRRQGRQSINHYRLRCVLDR